jgi:hypothetical protein
MGAVAAIVNLVTLTTGPHLLFIALRDGGPPATSLGWVSPIRTRDQGLDMAVGSSPMEIKTNRECINRVRVQVNSLSRQWRICWNKLWKVSCLRKGKHFFCRFAHNSLPLKMNIKRRRVELDTRCLVCLCFDED